MEPGKQIKAMDDGLLLPEGVIQHIQSLLSGKEAASTTALSRAWYNSWLTYPALDFDERYFQGWNADEENDGRFIDYVIRCMRRYDESNMKINRFRLCMNVKNIQSSSFAAGLIKDGLDMGASTVQVEYHPRLADYPLSREVFANMDLVEISVSGASILLDDVECSNLTTLELNMVHVEQAMFNKILGECVMLENLTISDCDGFENIEVINLVHLRRVIVAAHVSSPEFSWEPSIYFGSNGSESVLGNEVHVSRFLKLSCLILERVDLIATSFSDVLNQFPCLEELKVHYCDGCVEFYLSGRSLKFISIAHVQKLCIHLVDLPKIQKFKYSGTFIPRMSCMITSTEWESHISFTYWNSLNDMFFFELKRFLTELNNSKVFLTLDLVSKSADFAPISQHWPKPSVETVTITVHSPDLVCSSLWDSIIWSMQPKAILQRAFCMPETQSEKFNEATKELAYLLVKKITHLRQFGCNRSEMNAGWYELKAYTAEANPDNTEWHRLSAKVSKMAKNELLFRIRLKWRQ